MESIQILPAAYYQAIWKNNLYFSGHKDENGIPKMDVEERLPVLSGGDVDFRNFYDDLNNLGL